MKNLFKLGAVVLLAVGVFAQEATINSPVPDAKYKVLEYTISKPDVIVRLRITDASDNTKTYVTIIDNDTAAFLQALDQAIPNEAGGVIRKREARVLQRLLDAGLLPGVTIVP